MMTRNPGKHLRALLISLLATCIVLAVNGCSAVASTAQQAQPKASPALQIVHVETDWYLFHDLHALKQAAHGVVLGSIAGIVGTERGLGGTPATLFTFAIERILWNPHHQVQGSTVVIHQLGGIKDNQEFVVSDDPLFQVGERLILFLTQIDPTTFVVTGGPSGRFEIGTGQVIPINDEGVHFAAARPLDAFLADIQNA